VRFALLTACCAAAIGGCGSSGPRSGTTGGGGPLLQTAQCMRSHGVPNFPDPSPSHGLVIPSDINTQSPAFVSAQKACANVGGAGPARTSSESDKLEMLSLARCMRRNGLPSFADPTSTPPPPSEGNVVGGGGEYLAIGNAATPAFKHAAATCHFRVP